MDELFIIIGRLYADLHNSQKIIDLLQEQIKNKDQEISELKKSKMTNERP